MSSCPLGVSGIELPQVEQKRAKLNNTMNLITDGTEGMPCPWFLEDSPPILVGLGFPHSLTLLCFFLSNTLFFICVLLHFGCLRIIWDKK